MKFKKEIIFAILFLCIRNGALAQKDVDFWFAAPEISYSNISNTGIILDRPIVLRITTYDQAASVTISQPAGGGMPVQSLNIPANNTQTFDLTPWIDFIENKPANTNLNYGLHIESNSPVTIYYEVVTGIGTLAPRQDNPEIFVLKGKNALGKDFWIPAQNLLNNDAARFNPQPYSAFDIIATEDNTTINITPSNDIVGHAADNTFTIMLNKGQTYSATAASQLAAEHLQGSRVTSDKPVAITVKDDLLLAGAPYTGGCGDLGGDQIVPTYLLGKEYIAINGVLNGPGDYLFITATENNTQVSINGTQVATLNAGETAPIGMNTPSAYIQSTQAVSVWQLSGIGCELGLTQLPKIRCTGSNIVAFTRSSSDDLYLNIVTPAGSESGFTVNNSASVLISSDFSPVPGTSSAWLFCKKNLSSSGFPPNSVIRVENSDSEFQMGILDGMNGGGTSFGYFSNYGGLEANAHAIPNPACVGDDIQLLTDNVSGGIFQWEGPNGYSSTLQNPILENVMIGDTGIYHLMVTDAANSCNATKDVQVAINNIPQADLGRDTSFCDGASITLKSSGYYPQAMFLWNTAATAPTIQVKDSGKYWLTITNPPDCSGSDTILVSLQKCDCIFSIPNAFSPNNDGLNDEFSPLKEMTCPVFNYELHIYNRWGEEVFRSNDPQTGWNGKYNEQNADMSTYMFYIIYREYQSDKLQKIKGDLTLIR